MINLADDAMTIKLDYELPEYPKFEEGYRRAPRRESHLTEADKALAIKNALRYIHPEDRKSTRLNSSHVSESRMPSSA